MFLSSTVYGGEIEGKCGCTTVLAQIQKTIEEMKECKGINVLTVTAESFSSFLFVKIPWKNPLVYTKGGGGGTSFVKNFGGAT